MIAATVLKLLGITKVISSGPIMHRENITWHHITLHTCTQAYIHLIQEPSISHNQLLHLTHTWSRQIVNVCSILPLPIAVVRVAMVFLSTMALVFLSAQCKSCPSHNLVDVSDNFYFSQLREWRGSARSQAGGGGGFGWKAQEGGCFQEKEGPRGCLWWIGEFLGGAGLSIFSSGPKRPPR